MKTWFLNNQIKILIIVGIISTAIVFFLDDRILVAVSAFIFSLLLVLLGSKLSENSNWSDFSFFAVFKNVLGGALMIIGWVIFLRVLVGLSIAAVLLRSN